MSKRKKSRYYDPAPSRKRRSKGHRKGIEPAGLKRYRLAMKRRLDPGFSSTMWKGPRGGHFFRGPHKNRYDPQPRKRRFGGFRSAGRSIGGKVERGLNKYGALLGGLVGLGAGVYTGYTEYQKAYGNSAPKNYLATITGGDMFNSAGAKIGTRTPEISHLWGTKDTFWGGNDPLTNVIDYIKYKFLGLNTQNAFVGSAWAIPFMGSLAATLAAPIARMFTNKGQRFLRPIAKIGKGVLAVSTVGALALPGCGDELSHQKTTIPMVQTSPGTFSPVQPTNRYQNI